MTRHIWLYSVCLFAIISSSDAIAQTQKLAVINKNGEVWARDIDLNARTIGGGIKLNGPALFAASSDDQFVTGRPDGISVVTTAGIVWDRSVTATTVGPGIKRTGSLYGAPDAKYVFADCLYGTFVVNRAGSVFDHPTTTNTSQFLQFKGASLFGFTAPGVSNDKYVVINQVSPSFLVITTPGDVWAHDLTNASNDSIEICPDTIGGGHKLTGPSLFGTPANDKYVVDVPGYLLVINTAGQVWAHAVSKTSIGAAFVLTGPGLFGAPNDKYIVTYRLDPPAPPPN